MEGEVSFVNSKEFEDNITLIEAPNGSGKTELLFAFWWVLYGEDFDFKSLQNKEVTPYALNSKLYRGLQYGNPDRSDYCQVSLLFEHEGKNYLLTRKEEYKKTPKRDNLNKTQHLYLSEVNSLGQTSLPNTDKVQINRRLERIIPKKLLHGIIFDGERMQKISSTNEKAIEGIEGVISDVTSRDLISMAIGELQSIKRKYNSSIKGFAKNKDDVLYEIQDEIDRLVEQIDIESQDIEDLKDEELKARKRINDISDELVLYEKTKNIEEEYKLKKQELTGIETQYDLKFDELHAELNNNGALVFTDLLFSEVEKITSSVSIPHGLNVEAVTNILKKTHCICGHEIDEKMIQTLEMLKMKLPPDNVNSLILEIIRQKNNNKDETIKRLTDIWNDMSNLDGQIKGLKDQINSLSTQISDSGIDGEKLIAEREKLYTHLSSVVARKEFLLLSESKNKNDLEKQENKRVKFIEKYKEVQEIQSKINFVNKSLNALNKIKENYTQRALKEINENIQKAYKSLSEDAGYGRNIYITQYSSQKYKIITYFSNDIEKFKETADWENVNTYGIKGDLTEEQKNEIAILENAVSNSSGQSKAVTISFIKAILEYSMKEKGKAEEFEIEKNYPVVIDAPFGDLSGKNLSLPASNLNTFSEQVILMLAPDSYQGVKTYITNNIGKKYLIQKVKDENYSIIKPEVIGVTENGVFS
ncbi:AAA family ATPase [Oceanobacillus profundus]|nr:AAA family ATPase [Oceanobacillus profundus]